MESQFLEVDPFSVRASSTRGVKCKPAVGAATEPFILNRLSDRSPYHFLPYPG